MLKKQIIKIALLMVLLLSGKLYGQGEGNHPYSRFGIGDMSYSYLHPFNGSMGGLSYTVRTPNMINPFNPASYTRIDTCTFVFDVGFFGEFATLKDNGSTLKSNRGNLSHLLFGFSIFKWWKTSIGLLPVSDVNYNATTHTYRDTIGRETYNYKGFGGLNKAYWGNAFQILPNLSVGFNVNFLFGNINYSVSTTFDSNSFTNSAKQQTVSITNFTGDIGLQYFIPIKKDYKLGLALTYSIPSKFNANVSEYVYTFKNNSTTVTDSIIYTETESPMKLPQAIGFGVSFEKGRTWFVGADVTYTSWADFSFMNKPSYMTDNLRLSLGGNYTPDPTSLSYFKRVSYRAGLHYEGSRFEINGQQLNDMGIHVGLGLPFRKPGSMVNVNFEYGKFGTTNNGLVQKDYFKIGISFSSSDIWFLKAKYD